MPVKNNNTFKFPDNETLIDIIHNSINLINVIDCEGTIKYESNVIQKILGYNKDERIGHVFFNYIHPDEIEIFRDALFSEFDSCIKLEYRILHKNGDWVWIESVIQNFSEVADINGIIISSVDITERKNSIKKLKEQEEKFRLLLKNSTDTFVLLNSKGEQIFVSDSSEDMTGFSIEEVQKPFFEFIHPDDLPEVIRAFNESLIEKGKKTTVQYRHKHKENGWIWLEAVGQNYINNPVLNGIIVNVRDISLQKEKEEIITKQNQELKKLNEDKDRFMRIVGHDLRSPFNIILGFSELLDKHTENIDLEKIKKFAGSLYDVSKNTYNLLNDLLLWSKAQEGKLAFKPQRISFNELMEETKKELKYLYERKEIKVKILDPYSIFINVDINMFKTIFRNLLSNAIKFSNSGSDVNVYCYENDEETFITFSDKGIGIKQEDIPRLWDKSSINTTKGTGNEEGTGLGLVLCREFVEKHNGKIWVESKLGKGSDFIISLPKK